MTDSATRPLKIFLCHASADKPAVRKLYRYLRSKGMDPWLDAEKLLPGQRWEAEIPKALYTSDAIIVFLSKNSTTKEGYVQREIKFALDKALDMPEGRIFLIPARLEECELPESLKGYQWVDLFQKNWNRRLMSSLNERAAQLGLTPSSIGGETQSPVMSQDSYAQLASPEFEETSSEVTQDEVNKESQPEISSTQSVETIESKEPVVLTKSSEIRNEFPVVVEKELGEKTKGEEIVPTLHKEPKAEKSIQIPYKPPEKKKVAPKTNLRLVGGAIGAFLVIAICIWAGSIIINNWPFGIAPSINSTLLGKDGMTLIYVPDGEFTMGIETSDDEKPIHKVNLDAFWIDKTEVTNAMYAQCMECKLPSATTHYEDPNYANHPVVYVSWNQAAQYCAWAGRRLPTEAEWEKSARGTDQRVYPWGDEINETFANYSSNIGDTSAVGSYASGKSFYGAYDMTGNVWEWVSSLYQPYPYDATGGRENLDSSDARVLRGGSWLNTYRNIRAANRGLNAAPTFSSDVGFRCALSATQ